MVNLDVFLQYAFLGAFFASRITLVCNPDVHGGDTTVDISPGFCLVLWKSIFGSIFSQVPKLVCNCYLANNTSALGFCGSINTSVSMDSMHTYEIKKV